MQNLLVKYLLSTAASIAIVSGVNTGVFAVPIESSLEPDEQQSLITTLEKLQVEGLQRALAIDTKLSAKVTAIVNANKQRKVALENTYNEQMAELKRAINKVSDKEIAVLVSQLEQTIKELQALYTQKWITLKALLTDKQQARYLLYQDALQRELQRRAVEGLDRSATGQNN